MEAMELLPIILYLCLIILVVVGIVLLVRLVRLTDKLDQILSDVEHKIGQLNGLFEVVDRTSGVVNMFSERVVGIMTTGLTTLFNRRKKRKEEKRYE